MKKNSIIYTIIIVLFYSCDYNKSKIDELNFEISILESRVKLLKKQQENAIVIPYDSLKYYFTPEIYSENVSVNKKGVLGISLILNKLPKNMTIDLVCTDTISDHNVNIDDNGVSGEVTYKYDKPGTYKLHGEYRIRFSNTTLELSKLDTIQYWFAPIRVQ